ncbi:MAG: heparin lyase I family protein [Thermodesulfobacteriota bacterium]|nr:MAG: heparin lyase I family protein [Thermodesulfobacteriota bacterium]
MKLPPILTFLFIVLAFCTHANGAIFHFEGFESGESVPGFSGSSYGSIYGNPSYSIQGAEKASGSYALMHRFEAGQNGSYATMLFGDSPESLDSNNSSYQDIYIQFKLRYSPGYDFSAGNNKIVIIGTQDDVRHDNVCCNPWVANYITLHAGNSGSSGYFNVEGNNKKAATGQWFPLSPNISGYSVSNRYTIETGRWYTMEIHISLNAGSQPTGVFEMWIDGQKISYYDQVLYRVPKEGDFGTNTAFGINFVMLSHYLNSGAPQDQAMYYDDIILSTSYIGERRPSSPLNLRLMLSRY